MKKTGKGLFFAKSIHRTELNGPLQGAPRMKEPFEPTPDNPLIISTSEIAQFLRCRLQWNWDKRVGLRSKKVSAPRVNGIVVHATKEEFYKLERAERTPDAMKLAMKRAVKGITEVPVNAKDKELARAMLDGYTRWVRSKSNDHSDRAIGKRDVYPEWQFVLPLAKDRSILIRGKIDELFPPTIYKRVLAMDETKTKNQISFDMMDMDAQLTTYLWAMWKASTTGECPLPKPLRRRYDRFIAWRTVLRRQMPGPRVKAALFAREPIERTPDELKMWERDTRRVVRDMLDAAIYPTRRESCRYDCDYYELCLARGNKHDLKEIIAEQYTIKPK
jgi:hypothetical protein